MQSMSEYQKPNLPKFEPDVLLSKSTWDYQVAQITHLERSTVLQHIPEMLVWLQDLNWPGAPKMAEFLLELGDKVVPHVQPILQGDDLMWQYWLLSELIGKWETEWVIEIYDVLVHLLKTANDFDVFIEIIRCLDQNNLLYQEEIIALVQTRQGHFVSKTPSSFEGDLHYLQDVIKRLSEHYD